MNSREWNRQCTTFLLQQLLEAVLDGQPHSVVIASSQEQERAMKLQFEQMLRDRNIPFEYTKNYRTTEVLGSTVQWTNAFSGFLHLIKDGVGDFWDNSCAHWIGPFWDPPSTEITLSLIHI